MDEPKNSKTAGYKTATVGVGQPAEGGSGSTALFYATPDGVWHYFRNTQQTLMCDAYSTADLKKAFLGESCYDTTTKTSATVQL